MPVWVDRWASVWIDSGLSAVLVTGFTALAMIQCRQPVRRRTWGRLGLAASLLVIPLTWLDFLPRVDLRHPTWTSRTIELHPHRTQSETQSATSTTADPSAALGHAASRYDQWTASVRVALLVAYGAGLTLGLGRLALGVTGASLLIRRARATSPQAQALLASLPFHRGVRRRPRLLLSERTRRPVLVGWFRPTILIPPHFDQPGAEAKLRLGLLHELAHAEVSDYEFGLLAAATQAVWFFLPQVWWVRSQLRLDAEFLADHRAVGHFGTSIHYAESLVGLALTAPSREPATVSVAPLTVPDSTPRSGNLASALFQRVQMLLKCPFEVEDQVPRGWTVGAALFMVFWTLAAACLTIHDGRERADEVTWRSVDEAVFAFRLAELVIAPQILENRFFNLQFRLPPRFRLACEVLAEPADLADMEILQYRLRLPAGSSPHAANAERSPWRQVVIVRDQSGMEAVHVDGYLAVASHRPTQPASWLTIRPIPGRLTRLRALELTW